MELLINRYKVSVMSNVRDLLYNSVPVISTIALHTRRVKTVSSCGFLTTIKRAREKQGNGYFYKVMLGNV